MLAAIIISGAICLAALGFFAFAVFSLRSMLAEKQVTEDRLLENERHLQSIIDSTTALITVCDREGRYQLVNRRFEEAFGIDRLDASGRTAHELFSGDVAELMLAHHDQALEQARPVECDQTLLTAGGERSYMVVKFPLRDVTGEPYAVCAVFTDVTERYRLQAERDRIFNLSLDIMCVSGADGYAKVVNPQMVKTLGFTEEELLTRPFIEFVHPEDRESVGRAVARVDQGESVIDFVNRSLCKDGSYKLLSWRVAPDQEQGQQICVAREIAADDVRAGSRAEGAGAGSKVVSLHTVKHKG